MLVIGSGPTGAHPCHTRVLGADSNPLWTPNGHKLIFSLERAGVAQLFSHAADRTGRAEPLAKSPNVQGGRRDLARRRRAKITETSPTTAEDVMQLRLDESRTVTPLVKTAFSERNESSPPTANGWPTKRMPRAGSRLLWCHSPGDERPPRAGDHGRRHAPTLGAHGRELFYVSPTGAVMRVGVERGPSWAATPPTVLVKEGYVTTTGRNSGRIFRRQTRRQQFLMIKGRAGVTGPLRLRVLLLCSTGSRN